MKEAAISERHRFHQKHFLTLLLVFLIAGGIALVLLFMIRVQLITAGIIFGSFVIIYLLVNRWLKYFKELTGSLLYTGGVMLPAWSVNDHEISAMQALLIGIFMSIVLTNMLIFARFSIQEDKLNQQKSLATILGEHAMNLLIRTAYVACIVLIAYSAVNNITAELILLFVMEVILILVFEIKYFSENDRYRIYGDAIFLLPVMLFIAPPLPAAILLSPPSAG